MIISLALYMACRASRRDAGPAHQPQSDHRRAVYGLFRSEQRAAGAAYLGLPGSPHSPAIRLGRFGAAERTIAVVNRTWPGVGAIGVPRPYGGGEGGGLVENFCRSRRPRLTTNGRVRVCKGNCPGPHVDERLGHPDTPTCASTCRRPATRSCVCWTGREN